MEQTPKLDDYALFLAVADAGGLAGAARATGVSQPTLSRRLAELERRLGTRLFLRGPRGYALTARGRALADEAEPLRAAAARLARFAEAEPRPRVRITAGHWTSAFLARHIGRVWSPEAQWVPEFLASNANLDIARRVADIGVRNRRPEQSWLAGRATLPLAYAEYGAGPEVAGYLSLATGEATTPSERWLAETHGAAITTRASSAAVLVELARAGLGRVILPVFAGDALPGLTRLSPPIAALGHTEWLVAHHEARHDPPVRAALDALARLLTDTRLRPPLE